MKVLIENITNEIIDLLINNWGEATENKKKEIEKNISLYANDYIKQYLETAKIELPKEYINTIIENVIKEFNKH